MKSTIFALSALAAATTLAACGGSKSTPTTPTPSAATLTAPKLEAPAANEQLDTLRPTFTVTNASSDVTGAGPQDTAML